jgi:hypothetical protein
MEEDNRQAKRICANRAWMDLAVSNAAEAAADSLRFEPSLTVASSEPAHSDNLQGDGAAPALELQGGHQQSSDAETPDGGSLAATMPALFNVLTRLLILDHRIRTSCCK